MSSLQQLWKFGQSVWLDNLTREMLHNGELIRRVETDRSTDERQYATAGRTEV